MKLYPHTFNICSLAVILLIAGLLSACNSMHAPYEEFIEEGEIIYPGMPDSVLIHSGYNRVQLSWPMPADPTITTANISWHNGRESVEVSMDSIQVGDQARVILEDLEEGSYTFTIHHYDNEGNASIDMTTTGRVYGDTYANSLLPRIVNEALFAEGELTIEWGSADETAFANEVSYTDLSGSEKTIYVPGEEENTLISDYDFAADNTFRYRTMYRPDSMAVDTFYTSYIETRALGVRTEIDKTAWAVIDFSSEDHAKSNRYASYTIDGDLSTVWVNELPPGVQHDFPHWLIVDMGSVEEDIYGLSFDFQGNNTTPSSIRIRISNDGTEWTTVGLFPSEQTSEKQYIDFPEPESFRYFEFTAEESHGSVNIIVKEIGAYTR